MTEDLDAILLEDVHAGGAVLKIPMLVRSGATRTSRFFQDYLLLEQRTRNGSFYNRNIPGEGLLVWHVGPMFSTNRDELNKKVDLICADGLYQDAGYPAGNMADPDSGQHYQCLTHSGRATHDAARTASRTVGGASRT